MKLTETYEWNHVHTNSDDIGELSTHKSLAEVLAEESDIKKVVDFLEKHGIKIRTDYGYYRYTYDILKDISKHWEQLCEQWEQIKD